MKANLKIFSESGKIPQYSTSGSAGFDIESIEPINWEESFDENGAFLRATVRTGLRTIFDKNYVLKIYPRSGLGFKFETELSNTIAIIDSDYRGEIIVKLRIPKELVIFEKIPKKAGEKIAQGILEFIPTVEFEQLNSEQFEKLCEDEENERGTQGFGSTEKRQKD